MAARTGTLVATSIPLGAFTTRGSKSDSTVVDPNNGSDGGPGSSSGVLGSSGGGGHGSTKPCTGQCLQQKTCSRGTSTSIAGKVFDQAGKVPLYNVIVYVPNAPNAAITSGASCDCCGDASGDPLVSAITDTRGAFTLTNVPVGTNIPLVVQVGKCRREITIDNVPECVRSAIPGDLTRLPKNHTEGDIPLMALTTGGADAMACVLRDAMTKYGEVSGHRYAVLGVGERNGQRTVVLRNPWGSFEPPREGIGHRDVQQKGNGVFAPPADEFALLFDDVVIGAPISKH